ncbi:MAG: preprotein translocase subunit YajC [Bacteroidota bacterium]
MNTILNILLMSSPTGKKGASIMDFLPIILIIVVFYFFMIRPQLKKAKDQKKFHASIQKGDKVITIGGVFGRIVDVNDTTFIIEVEGGGKLKILKSAVSLENTQTLNETKKA